MRQGRRTNDDEPANAQEALIRATIRVIARQGLRGMTLRAVAAEAQLSHGLIRFHFGSRDALIEATMDYAARHSLAGATAASTDADDLTEIGSHLRDVAEDSEETLAFQLEMIAEARRRPELLPLAQRMIADYEQAVNAQLRAHRFDDPDLVILVAAAMDGLVQRQAVTGDGDATERAMESLRSILRHIEHSSASTRDVGEVEL